MIKKNHVDCILVLVNSTHKMSSVLRTAFTPCVTIYNHNNKAQYTKQKKSKHCLKHTK